MKLSPAQRFALRFGALMLLAAGVVMSVLAVIVDADPQADPGLTPVADPSSIALPSPGLFGATVVVYGASDRAGVEPTTLGCRLLSSRGTEQSIAKLSALKASTYDAVESEGAQVQPLFTVSGYASGSTVSCDDASSVTPVLVTKPSTFGSNALLVKLAAAGFALICLLLGTLGLVLTRPRAPVALG